MELTEPRRSNLNAELISKVPAVTLMFWLIKILATTLGETGGDAVTMTFGFGYGIGTMIFLAFFVVILTVQVMAKRFHPYIYWAVVVATTTVGTTLSDYFDRTLGLGYVKSSIILFGGVLVVLALWKLVTGKLRFENITDSRDEIFYWLAILVSNTLGTALGDFVASDVGLGFELGALVFGVMILVVALLHYLTPISKSSLFWGAYVLTRPLGATLGDTLTKPLAEGGLDLGRIASSLTIAILMISLVVYVHRRSLRTVAQAETANE